MYKASSDPVVIDALIEDSERLCRESRQLVTASKQLRATCASHRHLDNLHARMKRMTARKAAANDA